jgi:hypothetical protein
MIISEEVGTYNPLRSIINMVPDIPEPLRLSTMDKMRKELFKGGICCESDEEMEKALMLLGQLNIITVSKVGRTYYVSKRS